jgi:hypothetical protein
LAELGHYLRDALPGDAELEAVMAQAYLENRWFTLDNQRRALSAIATQMLDPDALGAWLAHYPPAFDEQPERTVGIVMAGNIPLVGFHDWLCVFAAGQRAKIKLSEKDRRLLPFLIKKMGEIGHESRAYTLFCSEGEPLRGFDAVIATGSNNTARYFEQYFARHPHIIRRNRNSVALIDGSESAADLHALGEDVFAYFGLGCRNVTKLYVPHGYNFDIVLEALHEYRELIHHDKYKNNFDYNMTLFLLNQMPFLNNGCIMLREDDSLTARISSVHYAYYDDADALAHELAQRSNDIQCVVGRMPVAGVEVLPFGQAQHPGLRDYADGVDVVAWLRGGQE